ncbi:hypothetical protein DHD80_16370 [Gramella sp. AN32]|nr:hypothetical protein [Gramella sp. AN32]
MQSVQLPNVGILLSKNGRDSEGAEVYSKGFCEIQKHRKRHQIIKWNSDLADLIHNFGSGIKCSFPKLGVVSKTNVNKLFSPNVAFREMQGNGLTG